MNYFIHILAAVILRSRSFENYVLPTSEPSLLLYSIYTCRFLVPLVLHTFCPASFFLESVAGVLSTEKIASYENAIASSQLERIK